MTATAAPETTATFVDKACEYRSAGGNRPSLIRYLVRSGLAPTAAERVADRIDLRLGIAHGLRPDDLSPTVEARLDSELAWRSVATEAVTDPETPSTNSTSGLTVELVDDNAPTEATDDPLSSATLLAASTADDGAPVDTTVDDYLAACGVDPDDGDFDATPHAEPDDAAPTTSIFALVGTLACAMIVAGFLVAWVGLAGWQSADTESVRPLGLCAIGAALALNGARVIRKTR